MFYPPHTPSQVPHAASSDFVSKKPVEKASEKQSIVDKSKTSGESFLAKFKKLHWGTKTAIIGGTVALGGALGYWAFKSKDEKRARQQPAGAQL